MIDYWKSLNKIIQTVIVISAGLVTFSAAGAIASEYRWWVWRGEFVEVAADSYKADISIKNDKLLSTRLVIEECRNSERCSQRFLLNLMKGEVIIVEEIKELQVKRKKIGK